MPARIYQTRMEGHSMQRTVEPASNRGSLTVTTDQPSIPINSTQATLRLRAEAGPETVDRQRVQWAEDVVDNEGMGKKSSKVCCIYHKPKEAGESSDESSSSSSDDSDSGPDTSRAQPAKKPTKRHQHHHHEGPCDRDDGKSNGDGAGPSRKGKGKVRKSSPNAYERIPKK